MIYVLKGFHEGKTVYKIGTTGQDPRERMRQIQSNKLTKLEIVAGLIGKKQDEDMFHHAFRATRLHGEWFSDSLGMRRFVEDFNIDQWDDIQEALKRKEITLEEAYKELTLVKFYDNETAENIAATEVRENLERLNSSTSTAPR